MNDVYRAEEAVDRAHSQHMRAHWAILVDAMRGYWPTATAVRISLNAVRQADIFNTLLPHAILDAGWRTNIGDNISLHAEIDITDSLYQMFRYYLDWEEEPGILERAEHLPGIDPDEAEPIVLINLSDSPTTTCRDIGRPHHAADESETTGVTDAVVLFHVRRAVAGEIPVTLMGGATDRNPEWPAKVAEHRWNGHLVPAFTSDVAAEVVRWLNLCNYLDPGHVHAHWDGDTIILIDPNDPDSGPQPVHPNPDGDYPIGAYQWTWCDAVPF
ncbi:hypothetical protein [Actinopolyspora halophila]|uniref:hypothetical protein n=1 Tax=Actinopolyspora halophila TaxID=1850 RepID=UPI0012FB4072|nr:hypothetical protein [Actinopolyspora halophila]